jgi:hypothetical protein
LRDAENCWDRERDRRERYVKLFRDGRFPVDAEGGSEGVSVNLCFAWTTAICAWLYAQNPSIEIEPRRGDGDRAFAEAIELWERYSHDVSQTGKANKVAIFDGLLRGLAWSKEGFDPATGLDVVDALSPLEVSVDPLARYRMGEARWVIHRVVKPLDEAKAFFGRDDLVANYELAKAKGMVAAQMQDREVTRDKDLFLFYEIWAKAGQDRLLLYRDLDRHEWVVPEKPWPFYLAQGEYPFSPLVFHTVYQGIDGFSEQQVVDGLEQEVEELAEFDRRHARRGGAVKVLYDATEFKEEQQKQLQSNRDYECIGIKREPQRALSDYVHLLDFNTGTDQAKGRFERSKQLYNEVLGWDELARAGEQRKLTATQSEILAQFSQLRLGQRSAAIDEWLNQQLSHRVQIARQLVDPAKVEKACGPQQAWTWRLGTMDPEVLLEQYSVSIEAGSSGERAKGERVREAQDNLALFAQVNEGLLAMQQPPVFDLVEAALAILRARNVRNPEKYMLQQGPPAGMPPGMPPSGEGGVPPEVQGEPGLVEEPVAPAEPLPEELGVPA